MKRIIFLLLTVSLSAQFFIASSEEQILLAQKGDNHLEHYAPADLPEVYYDSNEDEIIIIADGFSSYYNVYIIRNTPYQTVISTQISGYGDTIDISSLSDGNYTIVIISEFLNEFEGQFTII